MSEPQKLLPSEVGQAEIDLIEAVAKSIDPGAWDDRPSLRQSIASASGYEIDPAGTAASRAVNDRNRLRAREIAIDVIEIVRRATPPEDTKLREALEKAEADIKALLTLFETDAVFVGTGWAKFPDASAGTWPEVCVNISNYGADAEDIPRSEWQTVASLTEEFGSEAPEAWAAWRRGLDDTPKPSLGPKGKEALEALKDRAAFLMEKTMGSEHGHTPGPWHVVPYGDGNSLVICTAPDGNCRVCFLATPGDSSGAWETIKADARLIAAAPCMKEALEKSLRLLELVSIYDDADDDDVEAIEARAAWQRDLDGIRAALSKAEGQSK